MPVVDSGPRGRMCGFALCYPAALSESGGFYPRLGATVGNMLRFND